MSTNRFAVDPSIYRPRRIDGSYGMPQKPRSDFWNGFIWGALASSILLLFIVGISVNIMRRYSTALANEAGTCLADYASATQRIAELQTPIVLFEDKAPAELPKFDLSGLAEIRPGALLTAGTSDLKPRWVVTPGVTPVDVWRAPNSGYGLWDEKGKRITGPFKVQ